MIASCHPDIFFLVIIIVIEYNSTSKASMKFDNKRRGVPGHVPEYGAIFMSNSVTKRECYRRRLFGLPASQGSFVKHVKAGMILFLFEYEKRKLHGVFQACSDGARNIVPHAFRSSGKQFPCQVKMTPIWHCSPLVEAEFYEAIKENYFSANEFNFGLSEKQVHRLLSLFSLRKITNDLPQRQPNKVKVSTARTMGRGTRADDIEVLMSDNVKDRDDPDDYDRPLLLTDDTLKSSGYFIERERDEGRFANSFGVGNKYNVYNELGPVTRNEYLGDSLATVGRDGGRFAVCERSGSECTLASEDGPVMSNGHSGFLLGTVTQAPDNGRFATTERLKCDRDMDDGFVPSFSAVCPSILQPNLNRSIYSHKPISEAGSVVQDQLRPHSTFSGSIEPQISYPLRSTLYGDAIGMSTGPFDPDIAGINSRQSSPSEIDHSSNSLQERSFFGKYARNLVRSPRNQSYFPLVGPNDIKKCPNDSSGLGNCVPFSIHNHQENFCYGTSKPFSGASYFENSTTEISENKGFKGLSFSKRPSAPEPLLETGNSGNENKFPSSYSSSPGIYPCLNFDYGFPVESQGKLEHAVRKEEMSKVYTGNRQLSNKYQVQLHCNEPKSLSHDLSCRQYSENMFSGCEKSGNGVFSRLALGSDVYGQENGHYVDHEECNKDKSADEVVAMLSQSRRCHRSKIKGSSIHSDFNFDYEFPVESQENLEHEGMQLEETKELLTGNIPLLNKGQLQLHGGDYSLEHKGRCDHEPKSLNHDLNCREEGRNSVFSRLALASDVLERENGVEVGHGECDGDKSADEIMTTLRQSHSQWAKTKKSSIHPSFNFDYEFPVESQGNHKHEGMRLEEKKKSYSGNIPLSNKGQVQLHCYDYSLEHRGTCQSKSLNHDLNRHRHSGNMFSGREKGKTSVFSRLALASDVFEQENGDADGLEEERDRDKSADKIMAMSHQSLCPWAKTAKSKSLFKQHDVENFGNKKETTFYPKLEGDCLEMNLKEIKMNKTSIVEEIVDKTGEGTFVDFNHQSARGTPYVDFKRRSEVWKIHDDTKSRVCDEIAGSDCLSGVQRKRRKLIRPNFSQSLDVLSQESCFNSEDKKESCKALVGSYDKENKLSSSAELLHVTCSNSCEDKNINIDVERGSNHGDSKAGSHETFSRLDRKESSKDAGINNNCQDKIPNADDGLGIKDPMADQLSLGCLIPATSSSESFIESAEEYAGGIVNGDGQHGKKLPQSVENANDLCPVSGEIAIGDAMNSLSNQICTMRKIREEFVEISVDEDNRNHQQLTPGSIVKQS
ncbi:hypothetical protein F2P56_006505 [Juglans regia]|nr:hypothetical protein F2P56_006505 [Juglans regia]